MSKNIIELIASIEDPPDVPGPEILAIPAIGILIGFFLYVSGVFNASIIFLSLWRLLHNIGYVSEMTHLWKDPSKQLPIQHPFLVSLTAITGLIGVGLLLEIALPAAYHYFT